MNRRVYLTSLVASAGTLSGCTALGRSADNSQPGYYGERNIVYDHDHLSLSLQQETVHLGDTIEFEITNTGDSDVSLGCHKPWAIQKYSDEEWRHVTWTSDDYYDLCATLLSPGSSYTQSLTFSKSTLENQADEIQAKLTPGQYRFLLIGTSPYFATDFEVLDSG